MMFLALLERDLGKYNIYLEIANLLLLKVKQDVIQRSEMTHPRGKLAMLALPPEQTVNKAK